MPCHNCAPAFAALDDIVDAAQVRIAELTRTNARLAHGAADRPNAALARDLQRRIAELETANAHLRHVADEERRRADAAQDAVARSYRAWLDVTAGRRA